MSGQKNTPGFSQKITEFFQKIGKELRAFFLKCKLFFSSKAGRKASSGGQEEHASPSLEAQQRPENASTIVFDSKKLKQSEKEAASKISLSLSEEEKKSKHRAQSSLFRPRNRRPSYALGVIITTAKLFGLALLIFIVAGIGAVFGVANAYLGTTPDLDLEVLADNALTSYIYDGNGELITTYSGTENREYATLDEIPLQLQQAVIAVEDVRFYHHNGIDLKRILSSFVGNLSSDTTSGGSTITQQLIKNQLLSPERSYKRKIQEANLALQLEQQYSKDQILEAYLNTIPLGGTIYGVKVAAKDYFGKELNELTLRECACIAGITQYPWLYSPRRAYYVTGNVEALNSRIETVLRRMYTAGYISLEEMNEALNDEFTVLEESSTSQIYDMPHFVEYGIYDVATHLLEQRELEDTTQNRAAIENELRTKGYSIYLTVDPDVQHKLQDTISSYDGYYQFRGSDSVIEETASDGSIIEIRQPQAAAVVLDQQTGQIKGIVGSRDVPTTRRSLNRAYQSRMPVGSSIKPLAVYGPAFDLGLGLGSVIPNIPARIDGWNTEEGYPVTSNGTYGPATIRRGITSSWNIVAARTLVDYVGLETSYNYLMDLGISPEAINKDGIGLALGTSGISTLEMAGAYACIANGGEYREPLSFTQVLDNDGNVLLDAEQVRDVRQVFKPSTAFMLVEALKNAVQSGTGTNAQISGFTVAGKTGTVHSNRGAFFAGITGHYTSTLWIGHDGYKSMNDVYGSSAARLWQRYMKAILEGKEDKAILEGSASDYGVTRYTVCGVSGLKCTDACSADTFHSPVTDYFAVGDAPTQTCNMHGSTVMCVEGNCAPGPYCPETSLQSASGVIIPEGSPYALLSQETLLSLFPNLASASPVTDENGNTIATGTCPVHTPEWALSQADIETATTEANAAIAEVQSFLQTEANRLSQTQRSRLQTLISAVQSAINADSATKTAAAIQDATNNLLAVKREIQASLPDEEPSSEPSPSPEDSGSTGPSPEPSPTSSESEGPASSPGSP